MVANDQVSAPPLPPSARIEYVPLGELLLRSNNPKRHEITHIRKSIRRFGIVAPPIEDAVTGKLVAGHGRSTALQAMRADKEPPPGGVIIRADGEWLVPVMKGVAFESEKEAEAYLIADNRLVELGGWDDSALASMLQALAAEGTIEDVGYTQSDLDALLLQLASDAKISDLEDAPVFGNSSGNVDEKLVLFYANGSIRQVVLYIPKDKYARVVDLFQHARKSLKVEANTDIVIALLEQYANANPAG